METNNKSFDDLITFEEIWDLMHIEQVFCLY